VDINGDLVGINTAISSPTGVFAGYSFAVPSAIVKKVVQDLREFGVVQRGLLGARILELNTAFAKEKGIDRDNGVYAKLRNANGDTGVIRPEPKPESIVKLGADFVDLDENTAGKLNLTGGITVAKIRGGIISDQTRIRPGFIITKVNNRAVPSVSGFQKFIEKTNGAITIEGIYPDDPERVLKYAIAK